MYPSSTISKYQTNNKIYQSLGVFFINYLSTELFTGNLAGIPLVQQLRFFTFLLFKVLISPFKESVFGVSEHE